MFASVDVVKRCGDRLQTPNVELVADLDAEAGRRMAALALGQVTVRATSARMMLIATGYEREALSQARVSVEALIRLSTATLTRRGRWRDNFLQAGLRPVSSALLGATATSERFGCSTTSRTPT